MSEITLDSAKKLNINELKVELNKRGLSTIGKKDELYKRLIEMIGNASENDKAAATVKSVIDKDNLRCMIKEILNEEFTKQEEKITTLINGNFQTTMAELKKSQEDIKELKKEINDFKLSIQFTEDELNEKIENIEEKHNDISRRIDEINEYQIDPDYVYEKLVDLEDRSRRNNLRIYGVEETHNETWEKCEEHVEEIFREKLGLPNIRIERAHRVKRKRGDKSKKPRAIVCNLLSFKEKKVVLKKANKLKGTNIFIDEDYSAETMEYRKELWEEVKELRRQGNVAFLNYRSVVNKGMRRNDNVD